MAVNAIEDPAADLKHDCYTCDVAIHDLDKPS